AFLLGATVGIAVGLLYAPKSGKETRAQLKRIGEDFVDNAETFADDLKEKSKKIVEDGKAKIAEVVEKGKSSYSKSMKKSSDIQEDIIEE
ncbi:MAG: YtxH domain-containing protein, partial [Endomicrobiia bacterium]